MISQTTISRDDTWYHAFPDVAQTRTGRLVCVFAECKHHGDRSYTRIMLRHSTDRGRTWSEKQPLTEATSGYPWYNCPRLTCLHDGRLVAVVDQLGTDERSADPEACRNFLYISTDEGQTWSPPILTPVRGIVPDKLLELETGRWLLAAHYHDRDVGNLVQRVWISDDQGATWSDPILVGKQPGLNLCEASILSVGPDTLVAFMRENSGDGQDCQKAISTDNGETWGDIIRFPLPGCHRPVAGRLQDGRLLITHRYMQGGKGWTGTWTQNFFAAITDVESALAPTRKEAWTRILPIDFDRSPHSDLGYSGWVQFDDGVIYIVNYIVDDWPRGQIRGYTLTPSDFLLPAD